MKNRILNAFFNVVIVLLMILCVYGVICRINKKPLSIAGYQLYVIQSGSMEPELHKFDLTLVKRVDTSTLGERDIITFRRSDGLIVTHRIVEVNETGFVTKGDANKNKDTPIDASAVYGKNIGKVRYIGAVFDFLQSGFGVALLIIVLVAYAFKDKIKKLLLDPPSAEVPREPRSDPKTEPSDEKEKSETKISDNRKDKKE